VLVDGFIEELKEKYSGALVSEYLEEVRTACSIISNPSRSAKVKKSRAALVPPQDGNSRTPAPERDPFRVYGVNVLLAHNDEDGSPVIFETTPTYTNLSARSSAATTRAAAEFGFHGLARRFHPSGGRRIPGHVRLRRHHRSGRMAHSQAHVESCASGNSAAGMFFPFGTSALKPEPIDIDRKDYSDR